MPIFYKKFNFKESGYLSTKCFWLFYYKTIKDNQIKNCDLAFAIG